MYKILLSMILGLKNDFVLLHVAFILHVALDTCNGTALHLCL